MPPRRKPAVATLPKPTHVDCPFRILIDTGEQKPFTFDHIESNANTNNLPFRIQTERRHLGVGDYSIDVDGYEPGYPRIIIERKSLVDLYGSVGDRENFEWRLGRMCEECEIAYVVCEEDLHTIMTNPPEFQNTEGRHTTPLMLHRTIQSWTQRYTKIHWWFYPGREYAETATFWFLYRFHENIAQHKADRDRKLANHKAFYEGMLAFRERIPITECPYKKKHAIGDLADFWTRGWLEQEAVTLKKSFDSPEALP